VIRVATLADLDAIGGLLNALIATEAIEWTERAYTAEAVASWWSEHETVLVAETGGAVVGVAAYGWFRDAVKRPGYRFTVENTVHVDRDHWGSGVGRALMEALFREARSNGKHAMVAAIDAGNVASLRFHEALGFAEVGRMPEVGEKFGTWRDLVLLQLRLDEHPTPPSES
jgi:L-amino acid N-acyltransferase